MSSEALAWSYVNKVVPVPPATAAQMSAIEARFGGPLPPDYAAFLRSVNGGVPSRSFLRRGRDSFDVESFHGIGASTSAYDVEKASRWPSDTLGRPVVAIAGNGAGDQLIFLAPGDPGVYQWIHDEERAPILMAPSFTELLAMLELPPP
jgi:hypothetical protein